MYSTLSNECTVLHSPKERTVLLLMYILYYIPLTLSSYATNSVLCPSFTSKSIISAPCDN